MSESAAHAPPTGPPILVAEDNPISLTLLTGQLRRRGYRVVSVADGREALDHLRRADGPRLALLDWEMPGLDGPDVCRALRATDQTDYVYVILVTVRDDRANLVAGLEAGADDYLTKPVDISELELRLRTGLRVLAMQRELAELRERLRRVEPSERPEGEPKSDEAD